MQVIQLIHVMQVIQVKQHSFTLKVSWICGFEAFKQYSWNQIREDFSAD